MALVDHKYHNILRAIQRKGRLQPDPNRKGVNRTNITKYDFEYDLRLGFPAISTKELFWKGVTEELLWFLNGGTNIIPLIRKGVNFWNKDAYNFHVRTHGDDLSFEEFVDNINAVAKTGFNDFKSRDLGDLGPIYGTQWRNFTGIDQIEELLIKMITKPLSPDLIVTAWNPSQSNEMALKPCHFGFQIMMYELSEKDIIVANGLNEENYNKQPADGSNSVAKIKYGFDLVWNQRSTDAFLGLPINIASYALLAHIIGKITNTLPGNLYGDLRNVHLYDNSIEAANKQLERNPYKFKTSYLRDLHNYEYEKIRENLMNGGKLDLTGLSGDKFLQENYQSYPNISVQMLAYS